jgi:protein SCO1
MQMQPIRPIAMLSALSAFAVLLAGGLLILSAPVRDSGPTPEHVALTVEFSLISHVQEPVSAADFHGRWLLVFFGFTHCPDVCPVGVATLSQVVDRLGADAERVQPLMISVDPERDSPTALARYLAHFGDSIIGLTGEPAQIRAAAASFRAFYETVPLLDADDYGIDHTAFFYLISPERTIADIYPHGTAPADIAARLRDQIGLASVGGTDQEKQPTATSELLTSSPPSR